MGSRFRNLVLSPRLIIIYVLIAAGIIVFDSIALRIFVNLQEDLTFYTNLTIFTAFVLVFVFFSFVFLSLVKKISPPISKLNNSLSFIYVSIVTVQTAITFLLIIIIAQSFVLVLLQRNSGHFVN